jgi:hypothetical protein
MVVVVDVDVMAGAMVAVVVVGTAVLEHINSNDISYT